MSQLKTVLVAGGGYAGIIAANRLARKKLPIRILLITAQDRFQERIRNHQILAGTLKRTYSVRSLLHKKVELILAKIEKIDKDSKTVILNGGSSSLVYDHLVYSLGVQGSLGAGSKETYVRVENVADCERMHEIISKNRTAKITVLGAGLSGIETASELAVKFPESAVTLIDAGRFGAGFSAGAQSKIRSFLEHNHVKILENSKIIRFEEKELIDADSRKIGHDLCIVAGGLSASKVGLDSGFRTNPIGQIYVNQFLEVEGNPEILGAGDCAQIVSAGYGHLRMSCATALPMGIYAAERLAYRLGADSNKGSLPFSFAYLGRNVSLGRNDGVIQESEPDDTPVEKIWTERSAVWIKEMICKFTILSLRLEKYFDFYFWKSFPEKKKRFSTDRLATGSEK